MNILWLGHFSWHMPNAMTFWEKNNWEDNTDDFYEEINPFTCILEVIISKMFAYSSITWHEWFFCKQAASGT